MILIHTIVIMNNNRKKKQLITTINVYYVYTRKKFAYNTFPLQWASVR